MKRFLPLIALAAAMLLATPAMADRRNHDGYRDHDRRHGQYQDRHGGRHHDRRHDAWQGKRHGYQPFAGGYYDRGWQQYKRHDYRPRRYYYGGRYYDRHYRSHRHDYRAVTYIEPRFRHAWRWCDHHGGWFRIGDFVIAF